MPKVSIIIPVYNTEKHLRECLNSVVNQTLKDIEIIIINDCSTDNSKSIINEYLNNYFSMIKYIESGVHIGQGNARNIGISKATGDYIGFVDSDDFVDLNMYSDLYNAALNSNYPEIASGNIVRINEDGEKYCLDTCFLPRTTLVNTSSDNFNYLYLLPSCCDKIFRRDKIITRFLDVKLWEDRGFLYSNLFNSKTFLIVPKATYYYRIHHDYGVSSISRNINPDLLTIIEIANHIEDNIDNSCIAIHKKVLLTQLVICLKCINDILLWNIKRKDQIEIIRLFDSLICQKYSDWRLIEDPIFNHRIHPENLIRMGLPKRLNNRNSIEDLEQEMHVKILELTKKANHK